MTFNALWNDDIFWGAGPDMAIHTWTRYTPVFYWSQTDLSSVYKELVRFSFALSAASMYRQNVQTLPSLPLMARAWYKTVTSPSFDWKGLFTSPYQDSIYSIFVLNLFCKFKHERVLKKNVHKTHAGTCTPRQKKNNNNKTVNTGWIKTVCLPEKQSWYPFTPAATKKQDIQKNFYVIVFTIVQINVTAKCGVL